MTEEWLTAYNAGVFTEFQEQRARGILCSDTNVQKGFLQLKDG